MYETSWKTNRRLEWKIKGKKQSYKLIYKWLQLLLTNQKETWEYAHQRRKVVNEITEKLTKVLWKWLHFNYYFPENLQGGSLYFVIFYVHIPSQYSKVGRQDMFIRSYKIKPENAPQSLIFSKKFLPQRGTPPFNPPPIGPTAQYWPTFHLTSS